MLHKIVGFVRYRPLGVPFALAALFLLGGCAETAFLAQTAKEIQGSTPSTPKAETAYKIGKPYQIDNVWYYPKVEYDYNKTGIASWYGPKFDGRPTANGEIFDMNEVSAAHKTLPLPTVVRVTNLDNGRALNVRVNDRGPFAHGRIIDMSRRAAQLLGFERKGTALVRVAVLPEESRRLASIAQGGRDLYADQPAKPKAAPRVAVTSKELPPPPGTKIVPAPSPNHRVKPVEKVPLPKDTVTPALARVDQKVTVVPVASTPRIFIQAGAFGQYHNALRVHTILKTLGKSTISQTRVVGKPLFRVRLGPFASVEAADRALDTVIRAGYPNSRTVVE
ncbi:MAG: septal ring lytic transglycosylase RlpA family protein [Alphaproteobacteria bacterium]|nr:septal ring lytic transglycosylase RlpA family protein [Alphaproteobacteria bacterium]